MKIYYLENLTADGKIILKWIFEEWEGKYGLDCSGSEWGQMAGVCECGNEPSGFIKCGEFID
jgi:hypothetical protein